MWDGAWHSRDWLSSASQDWPDCASDDWPGSASQDWPDCASDDWPDSASHCFFSNEEANEDFGEDPALQERSLSLQGDAPPAMPLGIETCSGHEAATKSMLPLEAPRASQEKRGQGEAKQFFAEV